MKPRLELADVQGLVVRGYGTLPNAAFLLASIDDVASARAPLARWAAQVQSAAEKPADVAVNIALTSTGVDALLGARADPVGFSQSFRLGMTDPHRSRLLGDVDDDDPTRWSWGGPQSPTVHVLALVYARTPELLASTLAGLSGDAAGLELLATLPTDELTPYEAFGFHDGISQPRLEGLGTATDGALVRAGEFLLGYPNELGQDWDRPTVVAAADPDHVLPRDSSGAADLGRNGTYLVLRQLVQDVDGFWSFVTQRARSADGTVDEQRAQQLAAKMVGRWRSGAPLALAPDADDPTLRDQNDFGYHDTDPTGVGCPLGSHVRRVNPRDSLPPRPGTPASLAVNRRHRLLRRGRGYTLPDGTRGLHFICLNADLSRQYEFVQHSWANDPSFNGLHDSADPLVGPRHGGGGTFVEQQLPVRLRHQGLPQFVHVTGGAYFFLPGLAALRYLVSGPPAVPSQDRV